MLNNKSLLLIGKHSFISSNIYADLKNKINIKKISFEKFLKSKKSFLKKFNYICNCSITKNYIRNKYQLKNDLDYFIIKKIKKLKTKYIFLSSRKIYKAMPNLKEGSVKKPKDNYAKNKLITENFIQKNLKNSFIILRISNLIGKPLDNASKRKNSRTFIDNFFNFKKNEIVTYNNHFKDFLSIKQFTKIFYYILKKNLNGIYNLSLGEKVYIEEIINALNKNRNIIFKKKRITKNDSFYLNNKKLLKKINLRVSKKDLINYCSKI